jgi:plasmid stability protein
MGAMTLRNLEPDVVAALRRRARRERRSLNALICEILTREAHNDERRERSRKQRPRMEALRESIRRRYGEGTPSEKLIREDRDR